MSRGSVLLLLLATAAIAAAETTTQSNPVFTMCVPRMFWKQCVRMMEDAASKGIPISCISGRDRYQCIEKVGRKEADIVAVDPEDMYLAVKNNELAAKAGYNVVEQIRTKEESEEPYRYEAVAVVHKDLDINSVQGLRGLKSCHTGVGRNVGYKIPITKLTAMGVLSNINDPEYSARENELRALSSLFSKGCLVGTWSPDPTINQRLKETYSNLCALCEKPDVCDYPDVYSGYEGALRCLVHNGGDIAWTKVVYVKRFFGLPVGVSPAVPTNEDPSNYRYFCPDGTKVPIDANTKPCTWAARPWQGYMTNGGANNIEAMQKELTELGELGETKQAAWWRNIMLLDDKTLAVAAPPVAPEAHLKNAKYMDVIERNSGAPERNARLCVWSQEALAKCRAFATAAHSRDARPRLACLYENDEDACLKAVRDDGADLVIVEGGSVSKAMKDYNLTPLMAESFGPGSTKFSERPAVAVATNDARYNTIAELRGRRSCHSGYKGDFAGWVAPARVLKKANLINTLDDMDDFFGSSCAPGAPIDSKLCQNCIGTFSEGDEKLLKATKCKPNGVEAFYGGKGALRCVMVDRGEVAFMPVNDLMQAEKKNVTDPEENVKFVLVCPQGGIAAVDEWQRCNWGLQPPRVILSSAGKSVNALEELKHGLLAASSIFAKRPDLFNLFGFWGNQSNVLFNDGAVELISIDNSWDKWESWAAEHNDYTA